MLPVVVMTGRKINFQTYPARVLGLSRDLNMPEYIDLSRLPSDHPQLTDH